MAGCSRIIARIGFGAAVALCLSLPVRAATPQAAPPVFQFALQNGMQVLVIPDHRAAVVTQMLWFKVGGVDDPPGVSGLAHFFEHMMFRGTKQTPGDQYSQIIAKNGGNENAFTTHDFTAFYEQIAADRLKLAMDLEADRMANLDLSDNNVSTERDVVLEERRMRVDNNPQALVGEQMAAALHLSHPYGRPVIGWAEEVRRIDRVSAQDFYDHHYAPNNATLIVAGDVTPDQVRGLAQSEYGKVAAREIPPRAEFTEPPRVAETRMTVQRPDIEVPVFTRVYRVPSYAQAAQGQAEGLELLSQIMGGDQTSTLYRVLVEQKKLASDAGCNYEGASPATPPNSTGLCRAAPRRLAGKSGAGERPGDSRLHRRARGQCRSCPRQDPAGGVGHLPARQPDGHGDGLWHRADDRADGG